MSFLKNASLKNKLLLTVSIIVLVLISIIATQSITELNNQKDKTLDDVGSKEELMEHSN